MSKLTDLELFQKCKQGDEDAASELYYRSCNIVMGTLRQRFVQLPVSVDLEDIFQESFLAALKSEFRGDSTFPTYLSSIAVNRVRRIMQVEGGLPKQVQLDSGIEGGVEIAESSESETDHQKLSAALSSLETLPKRVVTAKIYERIPDRQLAEELGMTEDSIRSLRYRTIKKLADLLELDAEMPLTGGLKATSLHPCPSIRIPRRSLMIAPSLEIIANCEAEGYSYQRQELSRFAELRETYAKNHVYRITPVSLWNAAAVGMTLDEIVDALKKFSRYEVDETVIEKIREPYSRFGKLTLVSEDSQLFLKGSAELISWLHSQKSISELTSKKTQDDELLMKARRRGHIKLALLGLGYPVIDRAGYVEGEHLDISLREITRKGKPFQFRKSQEEAIDAFLQTTDIVYGGSGIIVGPMGWGKTMVGIGAMCRLNTDTLIVCYERTAANSFMRQILDKTTLDDSLISIYAPKNEVVKPITLVTYTMLMAREGLFKARKWGLVIFDEAHLLPADEISIGAEVQATRKLALTGTFVRTDGKESHIFALVGPKKYEVTHEEARKARHIAEVVCSEIRVALDPSLQAVYAESDAQKRNALAAVNPAKYKVAEQILGYHLKRGERGVIIGRYLDPEMGNGHGLVELSKRLKLPLVSGRTPVPERIEIYDKFNEGKLQAFISSDVGSCAQDWPYAVFMIQVDGKYGTLPGEAQRVGRLLRNPTGKKVAFFYSLVTSDSRDIPFADKRRLFLTQQGYSYNIGNSFEEVLRLRGEDV